MSRPRLHHPFSGRIPTSVNSRSGGFTLIEVVMAMSIMCIFLVALYGLSQDTRKNLEELDRESGRLTSSDAPPDGTDATSNPTSGVTWSWGPRIAEARWEPGPVLAVSAPGVWPGAPMLVGVWAQGWFLGEVEVDEEGVIKMAVDPAGGGWFQRAGQELILRTRKSENWGPPWRTVVLDSDPSAGSGSVDALAVENQEAASVLIHLPTAGTGQVSMERVSVSGGEITEVSGQGPLLTHVTGGQRTCVYYEGQRQSWWQEPGRDVDVIF